MMTRTNKTERVYRDRARQIAEAENAAARRKLSPVELVKAVMMRSLRPASRRQIRAALIFTMTEVAAIAPERAAGVNAAIRLLRAWSPQASEEGALRTSSRKQKNRVEEDTLRICHAALATASENAELLVAVLNSTELTGVRFVEWPTAKFEPSSVPGYAFELTVVNGKRGNGRSHGETRTLRWKSLPDSFVTQLTFWIAIARASGAQGRYDTLRDTLEALLRRVTKTLFPRRTERPTLSSGRHAAAARFKAAYVATAATEEEKLRGLAMVAALLGHATDATATKHYARAGAGESRYPVPEPDVLEVARIRRCFSEPDLVKELGPDIDYQSGLPSGRYSTPATKLRREPEG